MSRAVSLRSLGLSLLALASPAGARADIVGHHEACPPGSTEAG